MRRSTRSRATTLACLAGLALVLLPADAAVAEFNGTAKKAGVEVRVTSTALDRARKGLDVRTGAPEKRSFEYTSTYACQMSTPTGRNADVMCMGAIVGCKGNTPEQGQGPLVRLYRRELNTSGNPVGGWTFLGTTCYPERVPGKPTLDIDQILAAFHNTPWAKPTAHIQPEGNITLVTLPTYFEVTWPTSGFQPGEIDTITLLGTPVRIRPTARSYTYHFGDDTSFGPTTSPGGTYPDGDITHTYPHAGTYTTRIDITYSGEFSINGARWRPIPDTETVTGQPQPLTVKTAHSRLVTN